MNVIFTLLSHPLSHVTSGELQSPFFVNSNNDFFDLRATFIVMLKVIPHIAGPNTSLYTIAVIYEL